MTFKKKKRNDGSHSIRTSSASVCGLRSDLKEIESITNENGNYFETVLFVLESILYTDSHFSSSKGPLLIVHTFTILK